MLLDYVRLQGYFCFCNKISIILPLWTVTWQWDIDSSSLLEVPFDFTIQEYFPESLVVAFETFKLSFPSLHNNFLFTFDEVISSPLCCQVTDVTDSDGRTSTSRLNDSPLSTKVSTNFWRNSGFTVISKD